MITKDGRVAFKVLEKQNLDLHCDEKDFWVQKLLEEAAPEPDISGLTAQEWAKDAQFSADLKASKLVAQSEYQLEGTFSAEVSALCARCGLPMRSPRKGTFHLYFQLVSEDREGEDSGDADLILTASGDMDLKSLLSEQLMIQEPMVEHHPEGECQAPEIGPDKDSDKAGKPSPFARLKGLKFD